MKDVQMTFRVEPELRASFTEAAEAEHRPAAQVLREFMREYVAHVRQARASHSTLSAAEQNRRRKAFNSALASVGLEGFEVTEAYKVQAERFIKGEIEFSELTRIVHVQAGK